MSDPPAPIWPHLPSTHADVTIARDDAWPEENFDAVASRFEEWLAEHGVSQVSEARH